MKRRLKTLTKSHDYSRLFSLEKRRLKISTKESKLLEKTVLKTDDYHGLRTFMSVLKIFSALLDNATCWPNMAPTSHIRQLLLRMVSRFG